MQKQKPIVIIPANVIDYNGIPGHIVRDTYIRALVEVADCIPLVVPAFGDLIRSEDLEGRIGGILLTGAKSNVHPSHYGATREFDENDLDTDRDATTLPLIRRAIEHDIPLLGICRGFQELNVARGGTLHQKVHELPAHLDHRDPAGVPLRTIYETQAHAMYTEKGGWFEKIGMPAEFQVNSLHQQGIDRLGDGLHVEARAPDGLIEAVSMPSRRFVLATQWHPEGDIRLSDASVRIFKAFGAQIRQTG